MKINVKKAEQQVSLTLAGRLTYEQHETFYQYLEQLQATPPHELTIELSELEFVDSAGLGMLLLLRERLPKSTSIYLSGATAQVDKILRLTRMDQLFTLS